MWRSLLMGEIQLSLQTEGTAGGLKTLTEADKAYAESFSEAIDVTNSTMILQYGSAAQKKVSSFADSALRSIPDHDLEEISQDLTKLIVVLEQFERDFDQRDKLNKTVKSLYDKVELQASETARRLEIHRSSLLRHMNLLRKHYESCLDTVKEFDMYIYAGKLCINRSRAETLTELAEQAKHSGSQIDVIAAADYKDACARLERKLYDLSVTRQLPIQTASYIRTVMNSDELMAENLRRLNANAFPLWKQRLVLSMGYSYDTEASPAMFHETNQTLIAALKQMTAAMKKSLEERKKAEQLFHGKKS